MQMPEIKIKIRDKRAGGTGTVICGNSDYTVVWDLDQEWASYDAKTMRVNLADGTCQDVVFTGDTAALPVLSMPGWASVGLYAGDLHTSRAADLRVLPSVTTPGGAPADPPESVYDQITEKLNQLIAVQPESVAQAVADYLTEYPAVSSMRMEDGYIQFSGDGENWDNVVALAGLKSPKGDTGDTGPQGPAGSDASVTASSIADAMGLSGLSAGDQIAVDTVGADGRPASWKKKAREVLNVKDFGAKGDGSTDDTAAIQAALDASAAQGVPDVIFPKGTYKVSANTADSNFYAALTVHSGQNLIFDSATLQLTANAYDYYAVINIHNVSNVRISGGLTIIGDRESHTGTTGESGHGIRIVNSSNVYVHDASIQYTWGDGVCVGGNGTMAEISSGVTLERIRTYKCSRNGLSVIEAEDVVVRDCDFTYTDRVDPQYGVDIEPNLGTADHITLENVRMLNNGVGGLCITARKCTQAGTVQCRNIETDSKCTIYTTGTNAAGVYNVVVDGWRHTQKADAAIPTLRLSGKGSLWVKQLRITNRSANKVLYPFDAKDMRIDGLTVEDDPAVSTKGTLAVEAASSVALEKIVITGFLSRNPAEVAWYSGNALELDNLQDTVVNLNDKLTTGGSSESYKLLLCDKALTLGAALSARARVFIPYTYGNINPVTIINTTATEIQLYTTVSANITFVGDVTGGTSANSASLPGNARYEIRPMLAKGLVFVRRLDAKIPGKTSELVNDSDYITATQVDAAITDKGYQTAAQVQAAIQSAVGAAMEASY